MVDYLNNIKYMVKITELTYSFGRTIQLTQFNPLNIHVSAKAEITEKDDIKQSLEDLKIIVQAQVNSDIYKAQNPPKEVKPRTPNKFKGAFDGYDQFGNLQK